MGIDWIAGAGPHWAGFPLRAILSGAAILLACCTLWLTAPRRTGRGRRSPCRCKTGYANGRTRIAGRHGLKSIQRRNAEFVSAVSHEMKTPLAGIKAYVELLADGDAEDAETQEEFLSVINSQVIRLQRLVDSVLNLARIEAGVANVSKEGHLLNDLLGESLSAVRRAAEQKQIELVNELIPLESKVLVDHGMIVQAATNLLANAINYTPPGGTVVLRSWQAGDEVRFEVKDSGVGLSAMTAPGVRKVLPRAQGQRHGGRHRPGAAAGQAHCRGRARRTAFDLQRAGTGKRVLGHFAGCRFRICRANDGSLSCVKKSCSATTRTIFCGPPRSSSSRAGYDVATASDGQEAWEAIQKSQPDILVTDLQMPRMDGFELSRKIRASEGTRELPILMLTAKGFESTHLDLAQKCGVLAVLPKPFSPRELVRCIDNVLTSGSIGAEARAT